MENKLEIHNQENHTSRQDTKFITAMKTLCNSPEPLVIGVLIFVLAALMKKAFEPPPDEITVGKTIFYIMYL